ESKPSYRDELIDSLDPRSGLTGLEPAASALTGRCSDRCDAFLALAENLRFMFSIL
ncbi:hypothetical protein L195_g034898, partial [Trifolium pratense]